MYSKATAFLSLLSAIGIISLIPSKALAQTQKQSCYSAQEASELGQFFPQLKQHIRPDGLLCEGDLDANWQKIVQTLSDLKALQLDEAPDFKTKDDFSFKAIADNGWWKYFTDRASILEVQSTCRPGVIAFVMIFFPGTVNLCAPFFEMDRIGRLQVMLHEVRHFDGFSHVTCTRGEEKGSPGACDEQIQDAGSYAVSMQSSIAMGMNGKDFTASEKALARASALNYLHNKFNKETDVKIKQSLYLANSEGQIYEIDPKSDKDLRLVKKLDQPAKIYSASIETIIYPVNPNLSAYRMSEDFTVELNRLGLFATAYNATPVAERGKYVSMGYNGTGGFLTTDNFTAYCSNDPTIKKLSELPDTMKVFLTLENNSQNSQDFLISTTGKIYKTNCDNQLFALETIPGSIDPGIQKAAFVNGQRYALTEKGQVFELNKNQDNYLLGQNLNVQSPSGTWIDMATRTMPYLFEEALGIQ